MLTEDQVIQKLSALGFRFVEDLSIPSKSLRVELGLREFQLHAGGKKIAKVTAPDEKIYSDQLASVDNTDKFLTKPHGSLDGETERLLGVWAQNSWRCPVIVEAWWTEPQKGTRKRLDDGIFADADKHGENLWLFDEATRIRAKRKGKLRNGAENAVRMFVRDLSGRFEGNPVFDALVATDNRLLVGRHSQKKTGQKLNGPVAAPKSGEVKFPVTPKSLLGREYKDLSRKEKITFRVVKAVSKVECVGFFDSVAGDDRANISLGLCHWTLSRFNVDGEFARGELEACLAYLKKQSPSDFETVFGQFGLEPTDQWFPKEDPKPNSLVNTDQRKFESTLSHSVLDGTAVKVVQMPKDQDRLNFLRSWHWYYRFQIATRIFEPWQRLMWDLIRFRIRDILSVKLPGSLGIPPNDGSTAVTLGDVFQSESNVALLLEWHILFPGRLLETKGQPSEELINAIKLAITKGVPQSQPSTWKSEAEVFLKEACIETLDSEAIEKRLGMARSQDLKDFPHPDPKEGGRHLSPIRGSFEFSDEGPLYPAPIWPS